MATTSEFPLMNTSICESSLDRAIHTILGKSEEMLLRSFAYSTIVIMVISGSLLMTVGKTPYGRYMGKTDKIMFRNGKVAWLLDTLPSFLVPVILAVFTEANQLSNPANKVCLAMFIVHYFHRSFVYSTSMRGNTPVSIGFFSFALSYTTLNGYLQGRYHTHYSTLAEDWISDKRFVIGCILFVVGMVINAHSDHILVNLRKPGETGYKIPRGGLFEYVSCANFFGECIEWIGYALASWSLPAVSFAIATLGNIGPRAFHHHEYYQNKFEDYPKNRKALIPFII